MGTCEDRISLREPVRPCNCAAGGAEGVALAAKQTRFSIFPDGPDHLRRVLLVRAPFSKHSCPFPLPHSHNTLSLVVNRLSFFTCLLVWCHLRLFCNCQNKALFIVAPSDTPFFIWNGSTVGEPNVLLLFPSYDTNTKPSCFNSYESYTHNMKTTTVLAAGSLASLASAAVQQVTTKGNGNTILSNASTTLPLDLKLIVLQHFTLAARDSTSEAWIISPVVLRRAKTPSPTPKAANATWPSSRSSASTLSAFTRSTTRPTTTAA